MGFGLRPGAKAPDEPPSPTGYAPPLDSTDRFMFHNLIIRLVVPVPSSTASPNRVCINFNVHLVMSIVFAMPDPQAEPRPACAC